MKKIDVKELNDNFFTAIGKEWMIVSAGEKESFNMMTASWGGIGWLWNKPVAFVFIRPERHTFEFIEKSGKLTLSFLGSDDEAREIYQYCGSKSGKNVDKMSESGLTPEVSPSGAVVFEQSRLTLEGTVLYADDMRKEAFVDGSLVERWYGEHGGWHRMYVVEITDAWSK